MPVGIRGGFFVMRRPPFLWQVDIYHVGDIAKKLRLSLPLGETMIKSCFCKLLFYDWICN